MGANRRVSQRQKKKDLAFGTEKGDEANRQRALLVGCAGDVLVEGRALIGPVVAIFHAGQEAFDHFVFVGRGEFLQVLLKQSLRTVVILEVFITSGQGAEFTHCLMSCEGNALPVLEQCVS